MRSLHHLVIHVQKHGFKHRLLYNVSLMCFFWSIFDGILTYILPLKIVAEGFDRTEMGIIIGTSSIVGAAFDVFLSKFLKQPSFRRIYLSMFILSFVFAILLQGANTVWLYVLAMAVWGMYWDLYNFANVDFVSKVTREEDHASSFGVMGVFKSLGSLLAPLLAGLIVGETMTIAPFIMAGSMLTIAFMFYILLVSNTHSRNETVLRTKPISWIRELFLWRKIGKQLLPILILTLLIFVSDSFFWTIGPLLAEETLGLGELGGLFLVVYLLPPLLLGWFVGGVTKKFGKKKTALYSFLLGSACISVLSFVENPYLMLL